MPLEKVAGARAGGSAVLRRMAARLDALGRQLVRTRVWADDYEILDSSRLEDLRALGYVR